MGKLRYGAVKLTQNRTAGKRKRGLNSHPMLPLGQGCTKQAVQHCFGPGKAKGSESTSSELGLGDFSVGSGERAAFALPAPGALGRVRTGRRCVQGPPVPWVSQISGPCKPAIQHKAA